MTACLSGPPSESTAISVLTFSQTLLTASVRACFCFKSNAAHKSVSAICATLSVRLASCSAGAQSHTVTPASSANSLIKLITGFISLRPNSTAPNITSSDNSFASDSTISTACSVPATTKLSSVSTSSVVVGLSTYSPLI